MGSRQLKILTQEQMDFFEVEGYLMVGDIFDPADLNPVRDELELMIDQKVQDLITSGKLYPGESYPEEGFNTRLAKIANRNPDAAEQIMRHLEGFSSGGYRGKHLFETIVHHKLIALIEDFVGPEIVGSSVYRLRPKLPNSKRGEIPWHQDSGFWMPHCDTEMIITCWLPLVNATFENGCLTILPRAHKGELLQHYTEGMLHIKPEDLPEGGNPVIIPVPLGGAVFFTNRTPHCSTPNHSHIVRWSLDLRYQSADVPSNIDQGPEEFSMDLPDYEISCNPPEADFLIRSDKYPQKVIRTYEQFQALREVFERRMDRSKVDFRRKWPVNSQSKR